MSGGASPEFEAKVARPVHAIERPASMAMLVKTARALKVLHGPGGRMLECGDQFVFYTAGELCICTECGERLRLVMQAPHADGG